LMVPPIWSGHHIVALANDGVDRMTNVIALCANHHREAHFGEQRDKIEKQMIKIVSR
jgi:5-methylcytosine-specific restriction enzyme A